MVVQHFRKIANLKQYLKEIGMEVPLDKAGRVGKQKKIGKATYRVEGFIHSVPDGICNISLLVS